MKKLLIVLTIVGGIAYFVDLTNKVKPPESREIEIEETSELPISIPELNDLNHYKNPTPTPAPVRAPSKTKTKLPDNLFVLIKYKSKVTDSGVIGFPPGTWVEFTNNKFYINKEETTI